MQCNEMGQSVVNIMESQLKLGQQHGGKANLEQILASEKRSKPKRAGLWDSHAGIKVGKLTIWVK